jgi:hypothetical protein
MSFRGLKLVSLAMRGQAIQSETSQRRWKQPHALHYTHEFLEPRGRGTVRLIIPNHRHVISILHGLHAHLRHPPTPQGAVQKLGLHLGASRSA